MTTHKRIDGDYVISTTNSTDYVVFNTHTVEINGNLDVVGNVTYINVSELDIKDPFVILNASNTSTYSSNSGILTHKTSTDFAGMRYNNTANEWQFTSSTDSTGASGTWAALTAAAAGSNTTVQFNNNNMLAGNVAFTFDYTTKRLALNGTFGVAYNSAPSTVANTVIVYSSTPSNGGTGLYYVASASNSDELISRGKALIYALIF